MDFELNSVLFMDSSVGISSLEMSLDMSFSVTAVRVQFRIVLSMWGVFAEKFAVRCGNSGKF